MNHIPPLAKVLQHGGFQGAVVVILANDEGVFQELTGGDPALEVFAR